MKLATKTITATKREVRPTGRTITVSWSDYPQPVRESREVALGGEVTLEVDVEALLKVLGPKALKSKGRKAQECSGAVVVTARITSSKPGEWK